MMILIKKGLFSLSKLQPLYELQKRCLKADGYLVKIYWDILQKRFRDKSNEHDWLAYINNQLVGALQIYIFTDGLEITVLIDPRYRNSKLFDKMFSKVFNYLQHKNYLYCKIICNERNSLIEKLCPNWRIQLTNTMSEWQSPFVIPEQNISHLTIEQARLEDIKTIVNINHLCFPKSFSAEIENRFIDNLQENNRKIYLAINRDDQIIGKLHLREDETQVYIHEVGIIPPFQKKGFGQSLMINWLLKYSSKFNNKAITVDVLGDNYAGLALYKSCGFIKTNTYNYYELKITDLLEINLSLIQ